MSEKILIIVAHSDDETLGCGATLRRHVEEGDKVFAARMTNGVGARGDDTEAAERRRAAEESAAEAIGFEWCVRGDLPDNALDSIPLLEIIRVVERARAAVDPDIVYTHHAGDLNIDHRRVFQAVMTVFRPQPGERCREIRTFEVVSSTEWAPPAMSAPFAPNLWIEAETGWRAKLDGLQAYREEMRPSPHARSPEGITALAELRGHQVGLPRAEAFQVIRRIIA